MKRPLDEENQTNHLMVKTFYEKPSDCIQMIPTFKLSLLVGLKICKRFTSRNQYYLLERKRHNKSSNTRLPALISC